MTGVGHRFRGPLSDAELRDVLATAGRDALAGYLLLWDLLLAKAGQQPYSEHAEQDIRPGDYAIPESQATAILTALDPGRPDRHLAWVLAWVNHGPATYAD